MEDPRAEIPQIIHTLTQAPPTQQKQALEKYFLPNASFQHPFCKTSSFNTFVGPLTGHKYNSRWATLQIYQWYKLISPRIDLTVLSTALDEKELLLYVTLRQQFRLWMVYGYEADVFLTTVLKLVEGDESGPQSAVSQTLGRKMGGTSDGNGYMIPVVRPFSRNPSGDSGKSRNEDEGKHEGSATAGVRYYIAAQNDLYQTSEWIKFLVPWGIGYTLVTAWQLFATLLSILGAYLLFWQTWFKEKSLDDWPPRKI